MSTTTNPLLARLTLDRRWPPVWQCAVLAAVLMAATALYQNSIMVDPFADASIRREAAGRYWGLVMLELAATCVVPAVVAAVAATLAARHARSDEFRQLAATPITASTIVIGYLGAALYRARLALALLLSLVPAFLRHSNIDLARADRVLSGLGCLAAENLIRFPDFIPREVAIILTQATWTLSTLGASIVAAALGVGVGLALRRAAPAAALSAAGALVLLYLQSLTTPLGDNCYFYPVTIYPLQNALVRLGVVIAVGAVMFGLAWVAARRVMRQT